MKIFEKLGKLFEWNSKRYEDDFFGSLQLLEWKDPTKNYWEGKAFFEKGNYFVECFISTNGEEPPSSEQKLFVQRVFKSYDLLKEEWDKALIQLLKKEWDESILNEKWTDFKLNSISIPHNIEDPCFWELTIQVNPIVNYSYEYKIKMIDYELESIFLNL